MRSKTIALELALLAALAFSLPSALAQTITLTADNPNPAVGGTVNVTVNLADAPPFANWAAYLQFDNTKLQLTAQATGSFTTFIPDSNSLSAINTAGQVHAGGFGLSNNGGGSGTLGVFTFTALAAGGTNVTTEDYASGTTPFGDKLEPATGSAVLPTIAGPLAITIAQTYIWAASADGAWNVASNWNPSSGYPGQNPNDTALFNGSLSQHNCTGLGCSAISVANINITSGYSGTITHDNTLTVAGSFSMAGGTGTFQNTSGSTFFVGGNWSQNGGTFSPGTGTVAFNGTTTISGSSTPTFNNVSITGVLTGPTGAAMNVSGNWANSGSFFANVGTVNLTGTGSTQTLSGNTSFYNLSDDISGGAAAATLDFTNGTTQIIAGTLTLKGNGTNNLILRSTATGSQWFITPTAPAGVRQWTVSYVDVEDSVNNNSTYICPNSSTSHGNNVQWFCERCTVFIDGAFAQAIGP